MAALIVNGRSVALDVEPEMSLLWALRDELGLIGTKFGCGAGLCGACTVLIDGEATRSCITPIGDAAGKIVVTIEGIGENGLHAVQRAWRSDSRLRVLEVVGVRGPDDPPAGSRRMRRNAAIASPARSSPRSRC